MTKIIHWNCFQLKSRILDLRLVIRELKPLIISLNEIKMNEEEAREQLGGVEGYSSFFRCRTLEEVVSLSS